MNAVRSLLLLIFITSGLTALAQDSVYLSHPDSTQRIDSGDSIVTKKNGKVIPIETYAARFNPRRAILLAAVIPGAGQIYNKKYWKLPLVIGGFGGLIYGISFNQKEYLHYRNGLFRLLNEPATPVTDPATGLTPLGNQVVNGKLLFPVGKTGYAVPIDIVRTAVNKYRRDRDYVTIMTVLFYGLQMLDAHVDAHLKEFDLNPKLKVSIEPAVNQNAYTGRSAGVGFTIKF